MALIPKPVMVDEEMWESLRKLGEPQENSIANLTRRGIPLVLRKVSENPGINIQVESATPGNRKFVKIQRIVRVSSAHVRELNRIHKRHHVSFSRLLRWAMQLAIKENSPDSLRN
jgi:hypothetical protein